MLKGRGAGTRVVEDQQPVGPIPGAQDDRSVELMPFLHRVQYRLDVLRRVTSVDIVKFKVIRQPGEDVIGKRIRIAERLVWPQIDHPVSGRILSRPIGVTRNPFPDLLRLLDARSPAS